MRAPRPRRGAMGAPQATAWDSGRSPVYVMARTCAPRDRVGFGAQPRLCFGPRLVGLPSVDQLAGHQNGVGAIGPG